MPFLTDFTKTALIYNNHSISFKEVLGKSAAFSLLLPDTSDSRICIFSENRPEWIYVIYAAWHKKIIPVIFDYNSETTETAYILNETTPQKILCSDKCRELLYHVLPLLNFIPEIIFLDETELKVNKAPLIENIDPENMESTALIVYTSGTTGVPKGVMLSFSNLLANIQPVLDLAGTKDSILAILPFYHIFPLLWTVILPLYTGASIVFLKSLSPAHIMQTIQLYKITALSGVPKLFRMIRKSILEEIGKSFWKKAVFQMAKKIGSPAFSRLVFSQVHKKFGGNIRYLICGGAPIEQEVEQDFHSLGFKLQTGYGLTETSPMISFNRPGRIKIGSAGELLECNSVRIVDGEITVKGTNVMKGYFQNESANLNVFKDGWLYTGDLGFIDQDGYLFITGRKDDIIVLSNGKKIDPVKIETKLLAISDLIKEAAVVKNGDKLCAFIYPDYTKFNCPHDLIREDVKWKIINRYNETAPEYQKITSFELSREELPKTSLDKIKRFKLVPKKNPATVSGRRNESEVLANYFLTEKKTATFSSSHIEIDIGLDSLDKVLLLSFIESRFGIKMEQEELKRYATIKELVNFIQGVRENDSSRDSEWRNILSETNAAVIPGTWFTFTVLQLFFRFFFRLYSSVKVQGRELIPQGPVIFISNHQSSLDQFLVTCFLKRNLFRNTFYLAKEQHYRSVWKKFLTARNNTILVDNEQDTAGALKALAECLKKGKNILIFPEGTRSFDGTPGEFKKAYAILSCVLGIPVVPVVIAGSKDVLPRGTLFPKIFRNISVKFLEPVYPGESNSTVFSELIFKQMQNTLSNNNHDCSTQSCTG